MLPESLLLICLVALFSNVKYQLSLTKHEAHSKAFFFHVWRRAISPVVLKDKISCAELIA